MRRLSVRLAVLLTLFGGLVGLFPSAASAVSVPYSDPNAHGYIGFCDSSDHQITSGSITSYPFVVKAVASTPAPKHYGPPYGRAVLYAFQPIQYVDASNWSGKQLTGATAFTNSKAPMTIGTQRDPSMINFSSVYPLHVDGFAQVRMYFTALGQTQFISSYPSANIRISGNTWTQVGGGKVNCKAGQARSNEIALGAPTTAPLKPTKTPTKTSGGSVSGTGTGSSARVSDLSTTAAGQATKGSSGSSDAGSIVLIVVLVVLVLGAGAYVVLRRRQHTVG